MGWGYVATQQARMLRRDAQEMERQSEMLLEVVRHLGDARS